MSGTGVGNNNQAPTAPMGEPAIPAAAPESVGNASVVTQGYSYQREDGTIETADSVEAAQKVCPVLGSMSLKNAQVMLELAARGAEKMKADAAAAKEQAATTPDESVVIKRNLDPKPSKKEAEVAEKVIESPVITAGSQPAPEVVVAVSPPEKVPQHISLPEIEMVHNPVPATENLKLSVPHESPPEIIAPQVTTETIASAKEAVIVVPNVVQETAVEAIVTATRELDQAVVVAQQWTFQEKPCISDEISENLGPNQDQAVLETGAALSDEQSFDIPPLEQSTEQMEPSLEILESAFDEQPTELLELLPDIADVGLQTIEEPAAHSADVISFEVLDDIEPFTAEEIASTFEALIAATQVVETEINSEVIPVADEPVVVSENSELVEAHDAIEQPNFAEFLASPSQTEALEPSEPIAVLTKANEPFELIIKQLSQSASEVLSDSEYGVVIELLKTLDEDIELAQAKASLSPETTVVITPEITEHALLLLRVLGYEDPQKTLVEFVSRCDLEFLLDALRHLHKVFNEEVQPEVSTAQLGGFVITDETSLASRIGKAILRTIKNAPQAA